MPSQRDGGRLAPDRDEQKLTGVCVIVMLATYSSQRNEDSNHSNHNDNYSNATVSPGAQRQEHPFRNALPGYPEGNHANHSLGL